MGGTTVTRWVLATLVGLALVTAACSGEQSLESGDDSTGSAATDSTATTSTERVQSTSDPDDSSDPAGPADSERSDESDAGDSKDAADTGDTDDASDDEESLGSTQHHGMFGLHDLTGPASAFLSPAEPGDSGETVLALQQRLGELGFAPGNPDGSYGQRTEVSIAAFQDLVALDPTGIADTETVSALMTYRYDGLVVNRGDDGADVETLQKRLTDGPFDPGPIDGSYGTATTEAVWALEKLAGVPVDGNWGPLDEQAWTLLQKGEVGGPVKQHDQRWVEVDLSEQIMKVYDPDSPVPVLISHTSSGSGIPWSNEDHRGSSITPLGDFHINRRINGWRESSLNIGRLYNPLYFNGGIAFHGASSVPLYPASHGCIRLPMHIADYLPSELPNGTPVHILS